MTSPQLENGYTRIANEILDAFIGSKITIPAEVMRIVLFIIRKTYGYGKKEDIIALSQFALATGLKKPNIIRAVRKAIFMNLIIRTDNGRAWKYRFVKDFTTWQPLSPRIIVIPTDNGVIPTDNKSLSPRIPTIESKETVTKERAADAAKDMFRNIKSEDPEDLPSIDADTGEKMSVEPLKPALLVLDLLRMFQPVNPSYYLFVRNKTEIGAIKRLRDKYGAEELAKMIKGLAYLNSLPFSPVATTPHDLEVKIGKLEVFVKKLPPEQKKELIRTL